MPPPYRLWTLRTSPFAGKVRVAFAEKGVALELLEVHGANRPARLRELNPLGKVPVLELPDVALRESAVICEWLEETHPDPPLWPSDPGLRAWARGWLAFLDARVTADLFLGLRKWRFGKDPDDPEDVVERLHGRLADHWPLLEDALGRHAGPWLTGEQCTLADLAAMPAAVRLAEWVPHLQPDAATAPRVSAWLEALRGRPSAHAVDARGERVED